MESNRQFFDINIWILKWAGLWVPNRNNRGFKTAIIYDSIMVTYSILLFTLSEFLVIKESSNSIADFIKNLNMSLSFLLTFCKVVNWFYHRKAILFIMNRLQLDSDLFIGIDDFQPKIIILQEKKTKDWLTACFLILACLVPTTACFTSFYKNFNRTRDQETNILGSVKLPYYSWIPFDYKASDYLFALAVIHQCLSLFICGGMTVGLDMLYAALVSFMSAHLKISRGAFKSIRETCIRRLNLQHIATDSEKLQREMKKEVRKCIRHLQTIFNLCEILEGVYTYIILLQIIISLVVLCTCLFLVSAIPLGAQLLGNEMVYLLAIENQLAVYCYAGNKITTEGESLSLAVYECDWFSASESFKRCLLLTMMRMRRPIYLTIGKFSPLTLNTFVIIGRRSYSLLAFLKNRS